MPWNSVLLAAVISIQAATPATQPAQPAQLYRIELSGNQAVFSEDLPRDSGALVLFHRYPGGLLVCVKKADVKRVTAAPRISESPRKVRTGGEIMIGGLGGRSSSESAAAAKGSAEARELSPGENKDGTALLNPDRPYRPEWDSKQVPGQTLGYPNSPNDYREGSTFAYPPAAAIQEAPGEPPKAPPGSGEPPKGPQ